MFAFFLLRRIVTVGLCAGSFWLGVKTDTLFDGFAAPSGAAADCGVADGN